MPFWEVTDNVAYRRLRGLEGELFACIEQIGICPRIWHLWRLIAEDGSTDPNCRR